MVERFAAFERGFHKNAQVVFDLFLPDIFGELRRAQGKFKLLFFVKSVAVAVVVVFKIFVIKN
ncbi:MAG: hypothetical protein WKF71_11655 [Pyrinomonadaceae bacterium]